MNLIGKLRQYKQVLQEYLALQKQHGKYTPAYLERDILEIQKIIRQLEKQIILSCTIFFLVASFCLYYLLGYLQKAELQPVAQAADPTPAITTTPTQTPPPSITPTLTPPISTPSLNTPMRIRELAADWPVIFRDNFDNNAKRWPFSDTFQSDDFGEHRVSLRDGKLYLEARSQSTIGSIVWNLDTPMPDVDDFYLRADITCEQCGALDSPGVVFRLTGERDAEQFYVARMTYDQNVIFSKFAPNTTPERMARIATNAFSSQINNTNLFEMIAENERLIVFINGKFAAEVSDSDFRHGTVHFSMVMPESGSTIMSVDNVELRVKDY